MRIFIAIVYSLCLLRVASALPKNEETMNVIINGQKIESSTNMKEIQLDKTTTAKVEVSVVTNDNNGVSHDDINVAQDDKKNITTKELGKNVTSPENDDKKNETNNIKNDSSKQSAGNMLTKLLNSNDKNKDNGATSKSDLPTMQDNFNNDATKNGAVLTIKDGDKNININFSPRIIVECDKCGKNTKNVNNKPANKTVTKAVAKVVSKNNGNLKRTSVRKKTNQNSNKNKQQNINKQSIESKNNIETQAVLSEYTTFENKHKTVRGLYEKKNSLVNETVKDGNDALTEYVAMQNLNSNDRKQQTEVITKIIVVDEDANITQNLIDKLNSEEGNTQATAQKLANGNLSATSNSFKLAYANVTNSNFIQKYDIIREDKLKYGEVAFIDDYND